MSDSYSPPPPPAFPILKSKGADGQRCIASRPDEYWIRKGWGRPGGTMAPVPTLAGTPSDSRSRKILQKAGYLLVTAGQSSDTARLTAVASCTRFVGNGWMPVSGPDPTEAKGIAVFLNSTPGRLQLMCNPGRKLEFPQYSAAEIARVKIPDIRNRHIRTVLAEGWEQTRDMPVPQYREGECEVRRLWDDAVAEALGWDRGELARLRGLLHREPHVRGLGYNEFAEEREEAAAEDGPE